MKNKGRILILLLVLGIFIFGLAGCGSPGDPISDDLYSKNILPGTDSKYNVGSQRYSFKNGYFDNLYANGQPVQSYDVFTTSENGLVPAPGASTGEYLKDDGTWDSPGGGYTDEQAQDAVGNIAGNTTTLSLTYNDGAPSITGSVIQGGLSLNNLGEKSYNSLTDKPAIPGVDDTPANGDTSDAISSNWAYDHNAATLSTTIHQNNTWLRVYADTTETDSPSTQYFQIQINTVSYDLSNGFSTSSLYSSACDAGSGATAIVDADVSFTEQVHYSKVSWHDGYGYVSSVTDTHNLVIVTVNGNNIDVGDIYTIKTYVYTVPATGYYLVTGTVQYINLIADVRYFSTIAKYSTGVWTQLVNIDQIPSANFPLYVQATTLAYLTTGDKIALHGYQQSGATTIDVGGSAAQYTQLALVMLMAG